MVTAQTITVKGVVYDTAGETVIGATVMLVEDTSNGTMTDLDGAFTLNGVPRNATLRVSYVGYKTIELPINGQTNLKITLQEDTELLDEVVVTALGIKRESKALSYNVQELKGDDLGTNNNANFVNSLNGKVAGLTINSSSAGMGSAARVVLRGTKSIAGSNNALYVIDGVPIFSMTANQGSGQFASSGTTESAADINPDDIESISVLTGASAAALYGSAAANGAILITTKRGAAGRVRVNFSSVNDWGQPFRLPKFQNNYGSDGRLTSWGSPLSASAPTFDVTDFFQTAFNTTNSIAVSGGTEKNQTYLSGSFTKSKGLVPNNTYNRYNMGVRNTTYLLNDRLMIDTSVDYIIQDHNNFINQGEYMNPMVAAYLMPRSDSNDKVKAFEKYDPGRNIYVQNWTYGIGDYTLQNPYWIAYRNLRYNKRERYVLFGSAKYDILGWSQAEKWSIQARVRSDVTNSKATDSRYASTEATHDMSSTGYYSESKGEEKQTYGDLITTLNKSFQLDNHTLNLNVVLGASIQDTRMNSSLIGGPLKENGVPNLFNIFNVDQNHAKTQLLPAGWIEQTQSVFGSLELGWDSYIYLTLTGRNDWASQLANSPNSSFFYPSVGLSGVITDMLSTETQSKIRPYLSYLKLRVAYSSVATPFQRGLTTPTYTPNLDSKTYSGETHFPVGDLFPERTDSYEVGLSARMFGGILTIDGSYYLTHTKNQTFFSRLPSGSGYSGIYLQTGMVQNQGVELGLGLHLGSNDGLNYNSNFTLSYNKNEIKELAENYVNPITGQHESKEYLEMGGLGTLKYILKTGGSLGDIYTNGDFQRDGNGNIKVNNNGSISVTGFDEGKMVKLGSVLPDLNLGWTNELSYKGLSIGATITGRVGGLVVSMTQAAMDHYGVSYDTGVARDLGYVQDGNHFLVPRDYFQARGKGRLAQYYTYDATNFRLQEAHISYSFPRKWFNDVMGMSLSLYGRNLLFLYIKAPFDPESVASTENYSQGMDYFMLPSQRNVGFSVKLDF